MAKTMEVQKNKRPKIRHGSRVRIEQQNPPFNTVPKPDKTARMTIVNGRPYYYEYWHEWDSKTKTDRVKKRYLGKELPKGYRLVK